MAAQLLVLQLLVFALAWSAMAASDLSLSWLGNITTQAVVIAAAVAAGSLLMAKLEARRPLGPHELVRKKLRGSSLTEPMWLVAMFAAAFAEEFVYRGVLTSLVAETTGLYPAALISACVFGLAYLAQGWRGAVLSLVCALALQVVVVVSEGLFLAMVVHLAYDLGAAWLGRRLLSNQEPAPPD